jgi:hypothetical protein
MRTGLLFASILQLRQRAGIEVTLAYLPLVMLLIQDRSHQPNNRGLVGKDAYHLRLRLTSLFSLSSGLFD